VRTRRISRQQIVGAGRGVLEKGSEAALRPRVQTMDREGVRGSAAFISVMALCRLGVDIRDLPSLRHKLWDVTRENGEEEELVASNL
jgi:hypothetical protein